MPAGDGTGPMGEGPMTGRRAGYCTGYDAPGYANDWPGGRGRWWRGRGWGLGRGLGLRRRFFAHRYGPAWGGYPDPMAAPPAPADEAVMLREEAGWLKQQLEAIARRIEALEKES